MEMSSWQLLAGDKDYGGKGAFDAAFDEASRLYTVALDGQIRRYAADGKLEAKAPAHGGAAPFSIAVHPRGTKLAIGFNDTAAVEVYDARTLEWLYAADTSGIADGDLSRAAWGPDGTRLYAGGRYSPPDGRRLAIWQDEGRGSRSQVALSRNTVMQLLPCGDGIAAGAQDPAFGLIAADGGKRVWQEGVSADMQTSWAMLSPCPRTASSFASAWARAPGSPSCSTWRPFGLWMRLAPSLGLRPPRFGPRDRRLGERRVSEAKRQIPSA